MKALDVCRIGSLSRGHLDQCHPDLVELVEATIRVVPTAFDFSVICGHRGEEAQERAFRAGRSKKRWGQSAHNVSPSRALDFAPYPIDWTDRDRFLLVRGHFYLIASQLGIRLKPTITWDAGHIELA